MIVTPTPLPGVLVLDLAPRHDERGFFSRLLDVEQLAAHGVRFLLSQANVASTRRRGTVRGLHLQAPPAAEIKLVRCIRGTVWDVAVDVRDGSPTFGRHVGVELSADNRRTLVVPEGFAHGYQALTDEAEVEYLVSAPYTPGAERGYRHDDPAFGIAWPAPVLAVSEKDLSWPLIGDGAGGVAVPVRS